MVRTVRLVTLGCKVNQYETQYVKELLEHAGYVEAEVGPAELCVVNTCTVTHEGDAKSRQTIRRLAAENPGTQLVVMGCYASRDPDALAALPGVRHVITDKARLVEELRPYGVLEPLPGISRFDGHQRAFVKVQDGCLLNCSYCIIPSVRPVVRSRPAQEIVEEVARLVDAGYREIVLTGIHLGHYGIDLSKGRPKAEWTRLWHLLDRLTALPGDFRVRLSSLEAAEAREDLLRAMQHPKVCPHLHLCLQSGSDRVLRDMKRRYTAAGYLERVRRIHATLDQPAISTDVIVGFPGETEADFEQTVRVVREAQMMRVHVFSYSPRAGTVAAAEMPDDVRPEIKAARRERLRQLERELAQAYAQSLLGRTLDVLVEGAVDGQPDQGHGTACRYVEVRFAGYSPALKRQRLRVKAQTARQGVLFGEVVPESLPASQRPTGPFPLPLASG
ncbi:MAG: tRNA (N(6)-L-threonylcarbamoyladenosine(37)-C(2))-methylthiotransferase MtaB [Gemmataceae bacterium]